MLNPSIRDFFVSYARPDRKWAEWIAWQLKEAGHSVWIQAWHFGAGGNWVLDMNHGLKAKRTIAVLSPHYLKSEHTNAEWSSAHARDPAGKHRTLVPVLVSACDPGGVLGPRIYIDLIGLSEKEARAELFAGLNAAELSTPPIYPGADVEPAAEPTVDVATEATSLSLPEGVANESSAPSDPGAFFAPMRSSFPMRWSTPSVWREKASFFRSLAKQVKDPETKAAVVKQAEEAEQRLQKETRRMTALGVFGLVAGVIGVTLCTSCGRYPSGHYVSLAIAAASMVLLLHTLFRKHLRRPYQWLAPVAVSLLFAGAAYALLAGICTYSIVASIVDESGQFVGRGSVRVDLKESPPPAQVVDGQAVLTRIPGRFRDPRFTARVVADIPNHRLSAPENAHVLDGSPLRIDVRRTRIVIELPGNDQSTDPEWPDNVIAEIAALGVHPSPSQTELLDEEFDRGARIARQLLAIPGEPDQSGIVDYGAKLVGTLRIMYHIQKKTGHRQQEWMTTVKAAEHEDPEIMKEVTR
jgi:TIR domain